MEGAFCPNCGAKSGEASPAGSQPSEMPATSQPPAKKSKTLVYVLAGCGGLILLVLIVMVGLGIFVRQKVGEFGDNPALAAAKLAAALNPDVEVVSADEGTGKITLRDKKTGKTVTMNFRDVQKGHISFEGENGEKVDIQGEGEGGSGSLTVKGPEGSMQFGQGSLAKIPDWVPKYPGGQAAGAFAAQGAEGDSGTFQLKCGGSVEEVAAFYEREMKKAGMTVQRHSMQSGGSSTIMLIGEPGASGRTLSATITSSDEGTTAQIGYQIKK